MFRHNHVSFFFVAIVFLALVTRLSAQNIVANGSFETPTVPINNFTTFFAGSTFGSWTVDTDSIDLNNTGLIQASDGVQCVDLSGSSNFYLGSIHQDLPTVTGSTYTLKFQFAGNAAGEPAIKTMSVYWGDATGTLSQVGMFTFDTTGKTLADLGWVTKQIDGLKATSNLMRLRFVSAVTTPGLWPFLNRRWASKRFWVK